MKAGFEEVLGIRGRGMPAVSEVTIAGGDPVFSARFRIGEATANILAGIGVAVTDIHEMKTGRRQKVALDVRHAAATCQSSKYLSQPAPEGGWKPVPSSPSMLHMRSITQPWRCKDGRWYLPHFNLPHLHDRVIGVLGCESNADAVAKAIAKWDSADLEEAVAAARACGSIVRSNAEWLEHPHGKMLAARPLVEIVKIGDSDPIPFPGGERPLAGIKVLDLTRILAGPIAARTLAENGADVLMVAAPHLPQVPEHVMDTSHGKRSCFLNLNYSDDLATLKKLVREADVFSQGYRPGIMDKHGLTPEQLAAERPGIVYLSISCYGAGGVFSGRGGWEQIAQCATGICLDNGDERPKLLPASACDYTTGYNGAYGVLLALARRAREGGSYHVRVSLCRSGMYLHKQGHVRYTEPDMGLTQPELDAIMIESSGGHGTLKHLGPVLRMSETKPYWDKASPVLGSNRPEWLV
ncbi:MAG: CoA transferase [Betaproteobacteria bacterium]|nr:CoA transferase [Betaproteobacteria bacterium]